MGREWIIRIVRGSLKRSQGGPSETVRYYLFPVVKSNGDLRVRPSAFNGMLPGLFFGKAEYLID
jgi:hypothetical protein